MKEKIEEPEDLGIKIGTKDEAAWSKIRERSLQESEEMARIIEINKLIIDYANRKLQDLEK